MEADAENVSLSVAANVALDVFQPARAGHGNRRHRAHDPGPAGRARHRAGTAPGRTDGRTRRASASTSELASNQADLAGVRRARAEMENALATLVGQPASTFRFAPHDLHATPPPRVPAGLPSALLERRPDVAEAERELAAANARIGVAVAAFFPRDHASPARRVSRARRCTDVFNRQSQIWQIGPSIDHSRFSRAGATRPTCRRPARATNRAWRATASRCSWRSRTWKTPWATCATSPRRPRRRTARWKRRGARCNSPGPYRQGAVTFLDVTDAERTLFNDRAHRRATAGPADASNRAAHQGARRRVAQVNEA